MTGTAGLPPLTDVQAARVGYLLARVAAPRVTEDTTVPPQPAPATPVVGTTRSVRLCSIAGCGRKHYARGWCGRHYDRWKRTGTTDLPPRPPRPPRPSPEAILAEMLTALAALRAAAGETR